MKPKKRVGGRNRTWILIRGTYCTILHWEARKTKEIGKRQRKAEYW
jgi:hypothetical protein